MVIKLLRVDILRILKILVLLGVLQRWLIVSIIKVLIYLVGIHLYISKLILILICIDSILIAINIGHIYRTLNLLDFIFISIYSYLNCRTCCLYIILISIDSSLELRFFTENNIEVSHNRKFYFTVNKLNLVTVSHNI